MGIRRATRRSKSVGNAASVWVPAVLDKLRLLLSGPISVTLRQLATKWAAPRSLHLDRRSPVTHSKSETGGLGCVDQVIAARKRPHGAVPLTSRRFSPDDLPPLSLSHLAWFEGDEAGDGTGLGCNHDYRDLRGLKLEDVRRVAALESQRIESALEGGWDCTGCDEACEDCEPEVEGLELGVASAVVGLSALGCIPYTSCNGGVFGGEHVADLLIVGFYLRPPHVETVREAGRRAGVGLTNDRNGGVYVVTDDPRAMTAFAMGLGRVES